MFTILVVIAMIELMNIECDPLWQKGDDVAGKITK